MWERIDSLLERAPHTRALRFHRLELLEGRRRRAAGLALDAELAAAESLAAIADLAVPVLLAQARAAWDGPLVAVKGPEVALDYGGPRRRPFGDLDLLTSDAAAAQRALLAAGFQEVGEPSLYEDIHHLRPLWWPGLPLTIELHSRPKWPEGVPGPPVAELLDAAVPSRLGVAGVATLPPEHHAVLLAAHAWAHEPLARLGQLVDVAVTSRRADAGAAAALARRWRCSRLWRTTERAARAVVDGEGRSAAAAVWACHLRGARERTVLEAHLHEWLAPLWGLPAHRAPAAALRAIVEEARRDGPEGWHTKLARTRMALANAGTAQAEHDLALDARGFRPTERTFGERSEAA
jgi:hypothetical protein